MATGEHRDGDRSPVSEAEAFIPDEGSSLESQPPPVAQEPAELPVADAQSTKSASQIQTSTKDTQGFAPSDSNFEVQRRGASLGSWHPGWLVWWPEVLAMLLSISFVIATAGFLLAIDHKPLAEWSLPWHIKLNTVISLLITLCKTSLAVVLSACLGQLKWTYFQQRAHPLTDFEIFDSASRGTWGGLQLLCRIRWKALVASLGALATVLAIALEPFAQTTLSYKPHTLNATNLVATIPMATGFNQGTRSANYDRIGAGPTYGKNTSTTISQAIFAGIANAVGDVRHTCYSGNCTWPSFKTLGLCSSCQDVSTNLITNCTYPDVEEDETDPTLQATCSYQTPAGVNLSASYAVDKSSEVHDSAEITLWSSVSKVLDDASVGSGIVAAVSSIWFPNNYVTLSNCTQPDCHFPTPVAYDCSLSWCEQIYDHSTSTNGDLFDVASTTTNLVFPGIALAEQNSSSMYECYSTSGGAIILDGYVPSKVPQQLNTTCDVNSTGDPAAYHVNQADWNAVSSQLENVLPQYLSSDNGSTLAQYLYTANNGNFSRTFELVALALTKAVREATNATSAVVGNVQYTTTLIRVDWEWFIYPAALMLISLIFMTLTLLFSTERNMVIWKASSLAILFHGLQNADGDVMQTRTSKDMDSTAKKTWAKLSAADDGSLRLVEQ